MSILPTAPVPSFACNKLCMHSSGDPPTGRCRELSKLFVPRGAALTHVVATPTVNLPIRAYTAAIVSTGDHLASMNHTKGQRNPLGNIVSLVINVSRNWYYSSHSLKIVRNTRTSITVGTR